MEIVYLILGILIGTLATWLILRNKNTVQIAASKQLSEIFERDNQQLKINLEEKNKDVLSFKAI
jgi:Na+/glutamate symporter